ncbi:hypothetical protein L916_02054 [Phytophthora nicotianae]|uniref:Uncharacterized protein n=1 Tax=Phytophthora nicotianae TaxID=4792 RepID=W2JPG1_PHYNI|nr:hypothetical protein L916_02054 [Phytophthora nicotianae]
MSFDVAVSALSYIPLLQNPHPVVLELPLSPMRYI